MNFKIIPDQQTPHIPLTPELDDIKNYISKNKDMFIEFLHFASLQSTAVGLAGNQTSLDGERFMHRVFALKDLSKNTWKLIINPSIDEYIGMKKVKEEGCLTWVRRKIIADRNHAVKVSYYNMDGEKIEGEIYKEFEAQIWQHELNHLNGIEERVEQLTFKLPKEKEIGRNEMCPCNSGKKHKNCCL